MKTITYKTEEERLAALRKMVGLRKEFEAHVRELKAKEQELPDVVLSLMGAAGGQLSENDLNGREAYYKYIEEK